MREAFYERVRETLGESDSQGLTITAHLRELRADSVPLDG